MTCNVVAVVSLLAKREGIVMLVERRVVDENFVVNVGVIRDALLRVSVLVTIRGGVRLLLNFV
jgi:hypothetical protein